METVKVEKIQFQAPSGRINTSLLSLDNSGQNIAVVFPGAGYSCHMPLLYYSIDMLLLKGYQVLAIEKVYADDLTWRDLKTRESVFKYVEDDTIALIPQLSNRFQNQIQVLLGRSLGTYQIACALENKLVKPKQVVWQTASLYEKWPIIKSCGVRGFGIIGNRDQRYETALPHFPNDRIVIDGADHSMEIPGNVAKSIQLLGEVIRATDEWVDSVIQR